MSRGRKILMLLEQQKKNNGPDSSCRGLSKTVPPSNRSNNENSIIEPEDELFSILDTKNPPSTRNNNENFIIEPENKLFSVLDNLLGTDNDCLFVENYEQQTTDNKHVTQELCSRNKKDGDNTILNENFCASESSNHSGDRTVNLTKIMDEGSEHTVNVNDDMNLDVMEVEELEGTEDKQKTLQAETQRTSQTEDSKETSA